MAFTGSDLSVPQWCRLVLSKFLLPSRPSYNIHKHGSSPHALARPIFYEMTTGILHFLQFHSLSGPGPGGLPRRFLCQRAAGILDL